MSSRPSNSTAPANTSCASGPASDADVGGASDEQHDTDVLLVHGVTEDGGGLNVIRQRNQQLEVGAIHPAQPGRPIHGELVKLRPRRECPLVCDVDVQYSPSDSKSKPRPSGTARAQCERRRGPAHVASDAYRSNWDAIWAQPPRDDLVN